MLSKFKPFVRNSNFNLTNGTKILTNRIKFSAPVWIFYLEKLGKPRILVICTYVKCIIAKTNAILKTIEVKTNSFPVKYRHLQPANENWKEGVQKVSIPIPTVNVDIYDSLLVI